MSQETSHTLPAMDERSDSQLRMLHDSRHTPAEQPYRRDSDQSNSRRSQSRELPHFETRHSRNEVLHPRLPTNRPAHSTPSSISRQQKSHPCLSTQTACVIQCYTTRFLRDNRSLEADYTPGLASCRRISPFMRAVAAQGGLIPMRSRVSRQ